MSTTIETNVGTNDNKLTENLFGTIVKPTMCKKTVIEFITKGDKTYVTKFQGQTEAECPEDELEDKTPVLDNNGNPDPAGIKEAKEMYELAQPEPVVGDAQENAQGNVVEEEKDGEEKDGEAVVEGQGPEQGPEQGPQGAEDGSKSTTDATEQGAAEKAKTAEEKANAAAVKKEKLEGGKRNTKKANKEKKGGKGKKSKKVTFAISKKQRKARRNATHRK